MVVKKSTNSNYLWCKISNVCFLFLQHSFRYKNREITILNTQFLNFSIKPISNSFPNSKRPRSEDITARDVVIFNQLSFCDNLRVPV